MRIIFFLLSFFQLMTIGLIAQQDSLNSPQPIKTDSLPPFTVTMPDSLMLNTSLYFPTLGPWTSDSPTDLSQIFVSSIVFESPYTLEGAKNDIKIGKPRILFEGGFGGMPDFSSKADKIFQKKYNVKFYSQGCIRMPNDDQEGYNKVIFAYLDKKYGEGWRYELQPGAIGFEEPEKRIVSDCRSTDYLTSPLAIQLANPSNSGETTTINPETETSVLWYILPTSGFALLLALYFIKRKKD